MSSLNNIISYELLVNETEFLPSYNVIYLFLLRLLYCTYIIIMLLLNYQRTTNYF